MSRIPTTAVVRRDLLSCLCGLAVGLCAALATPVAAPAAPPLDLELERKSSGRLPPTAEARVRAGRSLAARHMAAYASCAELFAPFDVDGQELLSRTRVSRADAAAERRWCRRGAALLTHLGEPGEVWACAGRIERLGRGELAALLLHEALHHAGQDEWPNDPNGPTPQEITARVRSACRL